MIIPEIFLLQNYTYPLPKEKIAKYPLPQRDNSKLLHYKNGNISEKKFSELPNLLPANSLMIFNNSKVIPARLLLRTETGASLEVFCLAPETPSEYTSALQSTQETVWQVMIRNKRRWKQEKQVLTLPDGRKINLFRLGENKVKFTWNFPATFGEILEKIGKTPIPPYLKREAEAKDKETYQTIYAQTPGSVAAPTAGLHFTQKVLQKLTEKSIKFAETTLHVGAGTFKPVQSEDIRKHKIHAEPVSFSRKTLEKLIDALQNNQNITAVGTTSVRSTESLFFLAHLLKEQKTKADFFVPQNFPYTFGKYFSPADALEFLLEKTSSEPLTFTTALFIRPGYRFHFIDAMVTNFHQPQSSLLLLIASFIGKDWKRVYSYALENDFRFLSYGDASLLWRNNG